MRTYEKNDVALTTRAFVARSAYAEALSLVGRYDEALDKLGTLIREREERARAAPEDAAAARGVAYDMLVRATVLNRAGRKSQACRGFADAVERFSALDREGRLPAWDRKEHLGEARTQLSKCGPQSARTPTE